MKSLPKRAEGVDSIEVWLLKTDRQRRLFSDVKGEEVRPKLEAYEAPGVKD